MINEQDKTRLRDIFERIPEIYTSDRGITEIGQLIDECYKIAEKYGPMNGNILLNNLRQTRDKQYAALTRHGVAKKHLEGLMRDVKNHFRADLSPVVL